MLVLVILANGLLQNLVQPFAMGSALNLHPLVVLIVTIAAGCLFGTLGLILAAPLVSAAVHIKKQLDHARTTNALEQRLPRAPSELRALGRAAAQREQRVEHVVVGLGDEPLGLLAGVQTGGGKSPCLVARARLEVLLAACQHALLDLPQRLVDQRGQHRLGGLGERLDATRVAMAAGDGAPGDLAGDALPAAPATESAERLGERLFGDALRRGLVLGRGRSVQRPG